MGLRLEEVCLGARRSLAISPKEAAVPMTSVALEFDPRPSPRLAGALYLLVIVGGLFAEGYVRQGSSSTVTQRPPRVQLPRTSCCGARVSRFTPFT